MLLDICFALAPRYTALLGLLATGLMSKRPCQKEPRLLVMNSLKYLTLKPTHSELCIYSAFYRVVPFCPSPSFLVVVPTLRCSLFTRCSTWAPVVR
ncbi:hypothetical protein SISSUDRAFT_270724 [Sistotremastrum suecicum HHB10207 ss-3]|uniref:Uncharacterized protein n=1 Tax=Sistotremastrum suecicum HHB10207 ss-3 TaxID=1314776 RepID=A0A165ZQM8_9AGAM|nr:hypothetical protein SISSUDRAFT_270724 [Sistotremastrum suecicum HHB10207 ss-3]